MANLPTFVRQLSASTLASGIIAASDRPYTAEEAVQLMKDVEELLK